MDWHSSGIPPSVIGALKRGLTPLSGELGIRVLRRARQSPRRRRMSLLESVTGPASTRGARQEK